MKKHKLLTSDAISLLKRLIAIPSVSRNEAAAADMIQTYLAQHRLEPLRQGHNVWCLSPHFVDTKPTILLNSHIDTVKPVNGWTRDPFVPTEEDGKLYGLGSNDAGASLVSLLHVFLELCTAPRPHNYIFLASCEEEVSGENGVEIVIPHLPAIDLAIVGEPTEMHPAIAEKGLMVLDCTATGQSGHAARDEGVNAIYRALPDMDWFRTYRFDKESPLLGAVKMSVTMIQAGTQHNVVPDRCTFVVDVRSNECYSNAELFDLIRNHVGCLVQARSFRLNSSSIDPEHPFVRRCKSLGRQPFGSPTLSDQALMPFTSLKLGPGKSARSHTADEFVLLSEIDEGIELYLALLHGE